MSADHRTLLQRAFLEWKSAQTRQRAGHQRRSAGPRALLQHAFIELVVPADRRSS